MTFLQCNTLIYKEILVFVFCALCLCLCICVCICVLCFVFCVCICVLCFVLNTIQSKMGSRLLPEEILDPTSVSSSAAARASQIAAFSLEKYSQEIPLRNTLKKRTWTHLQLQLLRFIASLPYCAVSYLPPPSSGTRPYHPNKVACWKLYCSYSYWSLIYKWYRHFFGAMIVSYPTIYCTEHTGHWLARIENIFSFNRSLCALLRIVFCTAFHRLDISTRESAQMHISIWYSARVAPCCVRCCVLNAFFFFHYALCSVVQCYVHCSRVKGGLLGQIRLCMEVGHWVSDLPGL